MLEKFAVKSYECENVRVFPYACFVSSPCVWQCYFAIYICYIYFLLVCRKEGDKGRATPLQGVGVGVLVLPYVQLCLLFVAN